MKRFSEFLKEDPNKPIKQFGDNVTSSARVKATSDILKAGGIKSSQKKTAADVLGNLNRFFTDKPDSETLKVKPTDDQGQFRRKANRQNNVVDRPLKKTIPGKSKKVTVGALDKRDASIKKLDKVTIKPQAGDAKKTENLIKQLEKNITKPKKGEVKAAKELVNQLKPGANTTITPSKSGNRIKTTASKVTTNVTNTKDPLTTLKPKRTIPKPSVTTNVTKGQYKGMLDRIGQATGVKNPITKTLSKSNKVTGLSTKDLSKLKTKARIGGVLKGAGRFAGGAFAVKDAYDKARIEKAKGRSKTSQVLAGIARGAGGYLGAAAGATLGTLAGGGIGSFALGTGGAIGGYNIGTKIGDQIYKTGRNLVTGKKTFKDLRKDINKGVKSAPKKIDKFLDPSQR